MKAGTAAWCASALLAGCASVPSQYPAHPASPIARAGRASSAPAAPAQPPANGPVQPQPAQDGPPAPEEIPPDLASIPDAVPKAEPKSATGNPDSYVVYGDRYYVLDRAHGFKQRGYASWYGRKFQGQRTSSGEPYDMFKMTAAHKTLPIPCYVRVTNLDNGRQVVVRVNDRGPFHSNRIIDLSYAAAARLGMLGKGSTPVEIEALDPPPSAPASMIAANDPPPPAATAPKLQLATRFEPQAQEPSSSSSVAPGAAPVAASPQDPAPAPVPANGSPPLGAHGAQYLQAGLFSDPVNAATLREQLLALGIVNVILRSEARGAAYVHRVLIGPYADATALEAMRKKLAALRLPTLPVAR
ncbi:MAG: septal ring lytic transglycosylase RlpA family protein [Sinobacteraceae bacterium]|nr:septal ring lytic transglycosylase RlpA family protein [Nevskiaceae bacterium]